MAEASEVMKVNWREAYDVNASLISNMQAEGLVQGIKSEDGQSVLPFSASLLAFPVARLPKPACFPEAGVAKNHYDDRSAGFRVLTAAYQGTVGGGYLIFPEYGIGFQLGDGDYLIFDSVKIMYGVTEVYGVDYSKAWPENNRCSMSCYIDSKHLKAKYNNEITCDDVIHF